MASSDELRKDGWLYFKQDPQLGEIRGLDPWAVENGIHLIRTEEDGAEGIMMIRNSNRQQYGTVHGGVLVAFADSIGGHSLIAHGKIGGGGVSGLQGQALKSRQAHLRGVRGAVQ